MEIKPARIVLREDDIMIAVVEYLNRKGWRRPISEAKPEPLREHIALQVAGDEVIAICHMVAKEPQCHT